ncbi:MAG: CpsD/CapB family tyrosine-protein kinase [Rubrobacter sp.]|nr:CpsD/CapB family tyrosine-protein kinase [Rubrobacter sp.]
MNPETDVAKLAGVRADAHTDRILSSESEAGRAFAALAENLRSLGRQIRSVVVTGPEAGVGRTTVCLGLGAALASAGKKVTVVDCNLDRPQLHRWFGRPNFTGLTSALEGGGSLDDYGFDAAPNLRVVPTGPVLPGPWGLAGSPKLAGAVRALEEDRDVVLLDAPLASEVLADRALWGSFDGVLLVVHATRTPKGVARGFTDALLDARMELFGVVLNGHV